MTCLVHGDQLWNFYICYLAGPILLSLSTNQLTACLCARVCLRAGGGQLGSDVLLCGEA